MGDGYTLRYTGEAVDSAAEKTHFHTNRAVLDKLGERDGQPTYDGQEIVGTPGAAGKSAYDIWRALGNSGTEQDFLDSLRGADGRDGQDGENGQDLASVDPARIAALESGKLDVGGKAVSAVNADKATLAEDSLKLGGKADTDFATAAQGAKADAALPADAAAKDSLKLGGKAAAEYAAAAHSHTVFQIADFPASLPASDVYAWAKTAYKPGYSAAEVGLSKLSNDPQVKRSEMGAANGVATLDASGRVPANQLPPFAGGAVLEYASRSVFPDAGEGGTIYISVDDGLAYRWSGSAYAEISPSISLGDSSSTAYRGDRGRIAYEHAQITSGNPHGITSAEVGAVPVNRTVNGKALSADVSLSAADVGALTQTAADARYATAAQGTLASGAIPKSNTAAATGGTLPIARGGTGNTTGTAADSQKLGGKSASDFATAAQGTRADNASAPNLLVGGCLRVWQRGTSFTAPSNAYTADRWKCNGSGTVSKHTNGMQVTGTVTLKYTMEEADFAKISGKQVVLSYSKDGTVTANAAFTASSATVINMTLTAGVYNWFKLELGSIATPFVPRPYAEELALCQRYYEIAPGYSVTGTWIKTNICTLYYPYKVTKYKPPTIFMPETINVGQAMYWSPLTFPSDSLDNYSSSQNSAFYGIVSGGTDNDAVVGGNSRLIQSISFDAEI